MRFLFSIGCLASISMVVSTADNYCRAVAFSGGGSKGSWEAGVVHGLYHSLNPKDLAWDVVSGVSAGAINAGAVALFEP